MTVPGRNSGFKAPFLIWINTRLRTRFSVYPAPTTGRRVPMLRTKLASASGTLRAPAFLVRKEPNPPLHRTSALRAGGEITSVALPLSNVTPFTVRCERLMLATRSWYATTWLVTRQLGTYRPLPLPNRNPITKHRYPVYAINSRPNSITLLRRSQIELTKIKFWAAG
jgi:hypothetical protein